MKKLLCVSLLLIVVILPSCRDNSETSGHSAIGNTSTEARYAMMEACYSSYQSAQELVESADIVYVGKVTGISFRVLDATTALPPTEKTEERHRGLNTIYDIEISTSYKGGASKSMQVRMMGGIMNYRVEEQVQVMRDNNAWRWDEGIPVWENYAEYKIGETYLFVVKQNGNRPAYVMNLDQSAYNLHNPFKKHTIGNHDEIEYYSGKTDQYGSPIISARDVIMVFGKEKWDAFWTQWQKDNPDWETRLEKAEVKKALAEE